MSLSNWHNTFVFTNPKFKFKKEENQITVSTNIEKLENENVETKYEDDHLTVTIKSDEKVEKDDDGVKVYRRNKHHFEKSWYLPNYDKDSLKINKEGDHLSIVLNK
jgi:HSP20 family molecular chaperone IbpA